MAVVPGVGNGVGLSVGPGVGDGVGRTVGPGVGDADGRGVGGTQSASETPVGSVRLVVTVVLTPQKSQGTLAKGLLSRNSLWRVGSPSNAPAWMLDIALFRRCRVERRESPLKKLARMLDIKLLSRFRV